MAAVVFLGYGVATSLEQGRSRRQLPPRPGPGGHALDSERRGGTGHDPVPPGPRTGQTPPTCGFTGQGSTGSTFPPARKPGEPSVTKVTRTIEFHLLCPWQLT